MKTNPNLLQSCLLCAALMPAVVQAQFVCETNDDTITLGGYFGHDSTVTVPSFVTTIDGLAFNDNNTLTSVIISDGITQVKDTAFSSCDNLTNVTIPNSLTNFDPGAFFDCPKLHSLIVGKFNPAYSSKDGVLFNKSQTTLIACPKDKTSYFIPESVTTIGVEAFGECTGLVGLAIPDSVISISHDAFLGCSSLASVTIGKGVTSIGNGAFFQCFNLDGSIYIPSGVTNLDPNAFSNCRRLDKIIVDAHNPSYSSVDGVLFDKGQTTLLSCPEGKVGSYTIPASVTNIGTSAFFNCVGLTEVAIDGNVINIGKGAFDNCTALQAITVDALDSRYCSLDGVLFDKKQTTLLQFPAGKTGSYTIPDNVVSIGDDAFDDCTNLTEITVPDSVVSIGKFAFNFCSNLKAIYFKGDAPQQAQHPFAGNVHLKTIYYSSGKTGWNAKFVGVPTQVWNP
jgi:hypothetical protein